MRKVVVVFCIYLLCNGQEACNHLDISRSINDFQIDFFKELTKQTTKNIFCSGFSLSTALGMLLVGARTETATEIRNALGHQNMTDEQIQDSYYRVLKTLRGNHTGYDLNVANSIWIQEGLHVLQSYKDIVEQKFYSQEEEVDFGNSLTTDHINQWANNETRGKIPKLYEEPLSANTVMVLANAMYFKGAWEHPFLEELTGKSNFYPNGTHEYVEVDMMPMTRDFLYTNSTDLKASILSLPYKGDEVSMLIILPNRDIGDLERDLTSEKLEQAISEMVEREVSLNLPKFNVSSTFPLVEILKSIGISKAFQDADFSGITGDTSLFVTGATQKAVVEVNEKGTVAAVLTDFIMELSARPEMVYFYVNKPFLFVIRHKQSGINLFMGKVANPI